MGKKTGPHLCKCGCGEPTERYYHGGVFKSYYRYKKGHRKSKWTIEYRRMYQKARRDAKWGSARAYWLYRRYGITLDEFNQRVQQQGGMCALCQVRPATDVDHCHKTGCVRGILCGQCNRHLGALEKLLREATDRLVLYLNFMP